MERTHIQLSGITTHPEHTAGEMQQLVNLRKKNGSLIPVPPRKTIQTLTQSYSDIFIHSNSGYEHKIGVRNNAVYFISTTEIKLCDTTGSVKIEQIGNVVIVLSDSGIQYIVWKNDSYVNIGNTPELVNLSFKSVQDSPLSMNYSELYDDVTVINKDNINEYTRALILKAIDQSYIDRVQQTVKRQFTDAFFIRYAFKLYDNSYVKHSSPLLVMPPGDIKNLITATYNNGYPTSIIQANTSNITVNQFYLKISADLTALSSYSDIIKSIDIFASPTLGVIPISKIKDMTIGKLLSPYGDTVYTNEPLFDKLITQNVEVESKFHLIKSFDVGTNYTDVIFPTEEDETIIKTLIGREEISDDNFTHNVVKAKTSYVYNSRLHLSDLKTEIFKGFDFKHFVWNSNYNGHESNETIYPGLGYVMKVDLLVSGTKKSVYNYISESVVNKYHLGAYLSYPDSRAFNLSIYREYYDGYHLLFDLKLKSHDFLNLAYYISPDLLPLSLRSSTVQTGMETWITQAISEKVIVTEENKLKVSELNNPFYFQNKNTYTVGNGRILTLSSNALKVSEGQFGQYPLYVLTTNGIYALQIGSGEVVYSNVSPISFEMPVSYVVGQTPFGTIFITQKGLMTINGQNVDFISPQLEQTHEELNLLDLPLDLGAGLNPFHVSSINPLSYIHGAEYILFNPHENEIIIRDTNSSYTLVYNLQSKMFYFSTENFNSVVANNYPELHVISGANIKDYGQKQSNRAEISIMLRPLRFLSNDLKKLERIKLRGVILNSANLYVMHHASNDGLEFKTVRGFKNLTTKSWRDIDLGLLATNKHRYFTYEFACTLDDNSQINSIEVEVEKVYNNSKMI